MNVVVTGEGEFAEVQATRRRAATSAASELDALLDLAEKGGQDLLAIQKAALES